MIESFVNIFQSAMLSLCIVLTIFGAVRTRKKSWALLAFFYCSWLLGDLYWLVHLLFFGETPSAAYVSNISWYAAWLFLYLLMREGEGEDEPTGGLFPWIGPAFAAAMAVYYMTLGDYLNNLITGVLMGLLMHCALRGMRNVRGSGDSRKYLYGAVLAYCALEYAIWTISCFSDDNIFTRLYLVSEVVLALYMPVLLVSARKWEG